MKMCDIVSEIKLELTGDLLEMEIDDTKIESIVKKAMREIEHYWDETKLVTIPFASCIDMTGFNSSAIVKVYRTVGYGDSDGSKNPLSDPMYAQQWMLFSNGGTMYNLNDYIMNYAAWNTLSKIRNTMSTDLAFKEDKSTNRLYINNHLGTSSQITVEYIPKLKSVEEIKSDYWIDILIRMSTAMTKVVLGRIRTRYTQSNALWAQDGEKLLEEGNTELKDLREILRTNDNIILPID